MSRHEPKLSDYHIAGPYVRGRSGTTERLYEAEVWSADGRSVVKRVRSRESRAHVMRLARQARREYAAARVEADR